MSHIAYYTYILECADGTLYTGWAVDPQKRLKQHNLGKGAKYTRARLPVSLKAAWSFSTKAEAMRFECELKSLSRSQKLECIRTWEASLNSASNPVE